MILVLDASGAIEIALEKDKAKLFLEIIHEADIVVSPDTFISEVTSAFWKYRRFAQFTDDICLKGIEFCINLIDDFTSSSDLWRETYHEGIRNQCSVYDMFYLVTARRNSGMLVTMDKTLNSIAKKSGILVAKK
ncbi:MAG: type II toxin-antitoxin system VapC family toxin [Spirochaetales bacterium]|nr:type II toxin-antitoxin system VapC family toxin [Spirochaetales bacterium]